MCFRIQVIARNIWYARKACVTSEAAHPPTCSILRPVPVHIEHVDSSIVVFVRQRSIVPRGEIESNRKISRTKTLTNASTERTAIQKSLRNDFFSFDGIR